MIRGYLEGILLVECILESIPPALHYIVKSNLYQKLCLMIFELLFIILHILLYLYIVRTIQTCSTTTLTETFFDCPEFEVCDPWDSLTEEEYIENILENCCEDTDCSDHEPKQSDIFRRRADDYIGHYYQAGGKTKHCIVFKQWSMSSSDVQRLMVERRSNVLVPRDTLEKRWNNTSQLLTKTSPPGQSSCTID